jgi:hypothetical protein
MSDENDQVEGVEPDAVDEDDTQLETDLEQESDEEQSDDESQSDDDDEEVEHDGQKYKIPKALKPLVMMQADYTQKTQALAESRKAFEAETAQKQQSIQQNIRDVAKVVAIDERLQQFQQVNWQAISNEDPLQAQQLWFEFQNLKETKTQTLDQIRRNDAQAQQARTAYIAKASEEGNAILSKELPGWGKEMATNIMTFANKELGYSVEDLQTITDPRIVKTLHAAMIGHQVLNKQKTGVAKKPVTPAVPVKTVGKSGSPASKNPERMSTEEFMKYRNQQLRKNKR